MSATKSNGTAEDESAIYDRQIRLWGADAQSKMASAKVLYVTISGVSSEILKNLVLAGVRCAICDGRPYPDAVLHTPSSFLPPSERVIDDKESEGSSKDTDNGGGNDDDTTPPTKRQKKMTVAKAMQPHVHELNPLLEECEINESNTLDSIPDEYFAKFDIVIASQIGIKDALRIGKATTIEGGGGGKFYLVHSFGLEACAFMDLGANHTFRYETGKDKLSELSQWPAGTYSSLEKMMSTKLGDMKDRWHKNGPPIVLAKYKAILNYHDLHKVWPSEETAEKFVTDTKTFLQTEGLKDDFLGDDAELQQLAVVAMAEISPVCAVMGGVLGNEVIKALSGKGEPANNTLLFNGIDGGCKSFVIKSP